MARILQITDPHVVAPPNLVSGRLDTSQLLEIAIDRIRADREKFEPVDALVITGDITDRGDAESYNLFKTQIERLDLPYFLIPGNHDLREPMRRTFEDIGLFPASGKLNWVHDLSDLRIVGLDTLVPGKGGGILDDVTLDFLSEALALAPEKPALVALHHPPFACGIRFMDKIGLEGTEGLIDVLNAADNDIRIICGHVHNTIIGSVGNRIAIAGASTASAFATDFRVDAPVGFTTHPGGYLIHDWDAGFRSTCISFSEGTGPYPF